MNSDEFEKCKRDRDYVVKKYFLSNKFCMSYEKFKCAEDICRAHTISKKFLNDISENGHVYMPYSSSYNKENLYEFNLKGVNDATCFTGFCTYHDHVLFQSFEKKDFSPKNEEQIYDLTFRGLCRELFQKKCFWLMLDKLRKKGFQNMGRNCFHEAELEVRQHKFLYEQLKRKNNLRYVAIVVKKLPIAATGVMFPLLDIFSRPLQSHSSRQHGFVYNIFPVTDKTYIILSTVPSLHDQVHSKFLDGVVEKSCESIINYVFSYSFFNNDNIVIQKSWFESLSPEFKQALITLLNFQVGKHDETSLASILNFSSFMKCSKVEFIKNY